MILSINSLISNELIDHTKYTLSGGETLTYYIDNTSGVNNLDRYYLDSNEQTRYLDTIKTINRGHSYEEQNFIKDLFNRLDQIIDLDFDEMSHNNGSMLDIYHISYSSHFKENVIGQAIQQKTFTGGWWDIFWKNSPLTGSININSDYNTIIHEIGHSLGLRHPNNDPTNPIWTSSDTIMSYNIGINGWDTWFSSNDINALIKIWGREDDSGVISFDKEFENYKFKKTGNNYFIKSEIGFEDITHLKGLSFSDQNIDIKDDIISVFSLLKGVNDINSKIYRLYNAAFSRFPDHSGISYWIEQNIKGIDTYESTAQSFIASKEFAASYGQEISNSQFITNLYGNILNRLPDENGYSYWINQINKGLEDRGQVLMGFSESNENKSIFSTETGIDI